MKSIILQRLLGQGNSTGQHQMMHHMSCYGANTPFCTFCIVDRSFCCVPPCHRYDVWGCISPLPVVILLGVGMATVTEIEFSLVGFIHGFLATIATGLYQIVCCRVLSLFGCHGQAPPPRAGGTVINWSWFRLISLKNGPPRASWEPEATWPALAVGRYPMA